MVLALPDASSQERMPAATWTESMELVEESWDDGEVTRYVSLSHYCSDSLLHSHLIPALAMNTKHSKEFSQEIRSALDRYECSPPEEISDSSEAESEASSLVLVPPAVSSTSSMSFVNKILAASTKKRKIESK